MLEVKMCAKYQVSNYSFNKYLGNTTSNILVTGDTAMNKQEAMNKDRQGLYSRELVSQWEKTIKTNTCSKTDKSDVIKV